MLFVHWLFDLGNNFLCDGYVTNLIGTRTGRRTVIVNTLSLDITPNIVTKWTGHSDYKAMKPYIDIVDSIKASSMTKFDELI